MTDRITVQEAARRLGVKDDAIRKRIQRGTLEHDKDPHGRVFVYLDAAHDGSSDEYQDSTRYTSQDGAGRTAQDAAYAVLVERLRSELEDWKQVVATRDEELRRKDHIIAALTERIPELEAPSETREVNETTSEEQGRGDGKDDHQKPTERRSWLRRFFGFE
jgi:excisionase family DNA binding protein